MSLDRFVTGEHADEQQELGDPPEPTREHAAGCGDTEILEHATAASGAVVRGRRSYEPASGTQSLPRVTRTAA
jgi:hypothetical protein